MRSLTSKLFSDRRYVGLGDIITEFPFMLLTVRRYPC